ncbi:MAG TPA: site-specific DNA-methyltransferase [Chlorobaculum sp.]|uniref:site-specific DNA-methyltransferase (adenine-specific) n=1 Tax=Chlorobaculum tepidum (strain ATCC 49652 / DSM 12025 / NBRC 103806 / TLS) TaxID=194439 RepID=Q8KDY6_CHLTE|nr:site-specific DNA-methyltransferase [Chlorobaculum tepidum]AAM72143.1 type III restriction system methylase [Chlorobaculum tepidum TLS]HBU23129.1 site-specific DNA-methyltransferase [Chlorobaculum sp.]
MKQLTANDPETRSHDLVAENIARLKALFPELVTEGPDGAAVNMDVLKQLVGDKTVTDCDEKYGLNWHGKRRARQLALTPSTGTLRPCPEDSVDWDTTQNLMIEGDNLEVLKLLQKSYAGKIKLIYIDPPYNTGKDFVYPDDFKDNIRNYLELTGQVEGGRKISSNTEASGRFHTDWLNMMYPRLKIARQLLSPTGVIAVHIDEHELEALVIVLRDLFGEENELGVTIWDKRNPKGDSRGIAYQHESLVLFARDAEELFARSPVRRAKRNAERMLNAASRFVTECGSIAEARAAYRSWVKSQSTLSGGESMYDKLSETGRVYRLVSMAWPNKKRAPADYFVPLKHPITGKDCPIPERGWRNPPATMKKLLEDGLIEFGPDEIMQPQRIYFLDENMYENVPSIVPFGGSDDELLKELSVPFEQPKPVDFSVQVISWCSSKDEIVMDFFAGSGTTGHAVMAQNAADGGNRRYILVQLPEPLDPENKDQKVAAEFCDKLGKPRTIAELTKERLRRAAKKIKEENPLFAGDLGFRVFKLDSSNIRAWEPDRDNLDQTLFDHVEHLKEGRTEQDILYELLLKLGLDLCVPIETRTIAGKAVHSIGGGVLLACLATRITREEVEPLAQGIVAWHQALAPAGDTTCVFRDSAFADDVAKTNLAAILEQHGIANVRSL